MKKGIETTPPFLISFHACAPSFVHQKRGDTSRDDDDNDINNRRFFFVASASLPGTGSVSFSHFKSHSVCCCMIHAAVSLVPSGGITPNFIICQKQHRLRRLGIILIVTMGRGKMKCNPGGCFCQMFHESSNKTLLSISNSVLTFKRTKY